MSSLKRHHGQGHPQGPRSDSSSSQPDEEFVAENESLQSILSNTGITMATAASATERQTLAVAPTFKTPFVVNVSLIVINTHISLVNVDLLCTKIANLNCSPT